MNENALFCSDMMGSYDQKITRLLIHMRRKSQDDVIEAFQYDFIFFIRAQCAIGQYRLFDPKFLFLFLMKFTIC